jgi:hypothetical protein
MLQECILCQLAKPDSNTTHIDAPDEKYSFPLMFPLSDKVTECESPNITVGFAMNMAVENCQYTAVH